MTVICRTCLNEINDDSVTFYLDSTDTNSTTITVRCKLEHCIPEMDLDVVPNAVICNSCLERLTLAHEFKNKCLETEGRIQSYIEQMGYILTCIDLRDIVEQSKIRPSFQTTELFDQPIYSSQDFFAPTIYDTNRNPIMPLFEAPKEKSLDIKNLQCDTKDFFAVPKIAQLLADGNTLKCTQCNYTTSNDLELKSHESNHSTQKLHKCSECDYSASKRQTLIIHKRKHTGEKLYNCNDCGYDTPYKNTFVQHLHTHVGEGPYKCTLCDFSSVCNSALDAHIQTHMDNKPYRGRLKFDLQAHMRVHTGEKPYKCLLCDYSSSHKTNIVYHMRIHTGEKPYKCKMCDHKFSHKVNLRNHMRTQHKYVKILDPKPYLCTFCDYSTSRKINLVKHIMIHTGEKPYQCFDCGFNTVTKSDLERHVRMHTTQKPENLQKGTTECVGNSANIHENTDYKMAPDLSNYESAVKTK